MELRFKNTFSGRVAHNNNFAHTRHTSDPYPSMKEPGLHRTPSRKGKTLETDPDSTATSLRQNTATQQRHLPPRHPSATNGARQKTLTLRFPHRPTTTSQCPANVGLTAGEESQSIDHELVSRHGSDCPEPQRQKTTDSCPAIDVREWLDEKRFVGFSAGEVGCLPQQQGFRIGVLL